MDLTVDPLKPAGEAWPNRGYAWWVVIALMIAYAFSIVDRTALGLLVQPIEADLHISDTLMGLLQGTAFALFYAVLGLPLGLLADRINRRRLITAGIAVWSAATMACGLASGFVGLFAARLGVGAGEATLSPAGASLIADYFPAEERPKAYGVYAVGTSIGGGMAFLLGGAAIAVAGHLRLTAPGVFGDLASWKIVFLIIGAPGLLISLIFALSVREPIRRGRGQIVGKASFAPLFAQLSKERLVYASLILGAVFNATCIYAVVSWFPTLMIRGDGLAPARVGQLLGTFGTPCGVISCIGSGWLAAWLEKRGRPDASVLVALGGTLWFTDGGGRRSRPRLGRETRGLLSAEPGDQLLHGLHFYGAQSHHTQRTSRSDHRCVQPVHGPVFPYRWSLLCRVPLRSRIRSPRRHRQGSRQCPGGLGHSGRAPVQPGPSSVPRTLGGRLSGMLRTVRPSRTHEAV